MYLKFMFSKKATKIYKIITVDLTFTSYCQLDGEDFVNFCGLLRKRELYQSASETKRTQFIYEIRVWRTHKLTTLTT